MTNAKCQEYLNELYDKYLGRFKAKQTTVNELVYVLRMTGEEWQINTFDKKVKNKWECIPDVRDTFIPVKDLMKKVVSVEFDEETYKDMGIKLLLVEVTD